MLTCGLSLLKARPDESPFMTASPLSEALLIWFAEAARVMPWRTEKNPYYIWVSEIMLQQTQVATVMPYFERFIARFPTVKALASAPLDDVLKHWEGLGYYSRARNLHKGAQYVVEHFYAQVPRTPAAIREIPGIGPYSAGAILSIAYGVPEPAIDGNVIRVFSRLFALKTTFDKAQPKRDLEALVRQHIPADAAGDFNQALMELGALICRPKNPDCEGCPVAAFCQARTEGDPTRYPFKGKKTAVKAVTLPVVWLQNEQGQVLVCKQNEKGIFKGLWCLPARAVLNDPEWGFVVEDQGVITTIEHTLTHRQLTLEVHQALLLRQPKTLPQDWAWVEPQENYTHAIPVAYQKVFRFMVEHPLLGLMV